MTSYVPPYKKFYNPDEDPKFAGQVPVRYPGYQGAPISLNQTACAPPPSQHTVVVTQPGAANVSTKQVQSLVVKCALNFYSKNRDFIGRYR